MGSARRRGVPVGKWPTAGETVAAQAVVQGIDCGFSGTEPTPDMWVAFRLGACEVSATSVLQAR